jgi:hypothetical protein
MAGSEYHVKTLLESSAALGVLLSEVMDAKYGEEWLEWDPLTIALELGDDFGADPSTESMDRLCAMQIVRTSDEFFTRPDAFIGICNTLSAGSPAFEVMDPPTAPEVAWALAEVAMARPSAVMSQAVREFVEASMREAGFAGSAMPPIVREALGPDPDADDVAEAAVDMSLRDMNLGEIEDFVDAQLALLTAQLDATADLTGGSDALSAKLRKMSLSTNM